MVTTKAFVMDKSVYEKRRLRGTLTCRRCGETQRVGDHVVSRRIRYRNVLYCDLCADLLNIVVGSK